MKNLKDMDALLKEWKPQVPADQAAQFANLEKRFEEFRTFRTETARLGREVSPQDANAQGNNEANRENRKAYQAEIDAVVKADLKQLSEFKVHVENFGHTIFLVVVIVTAAGVIAGMLLGLYMASKELSGPILKLSGSMNAVAEGDLEAEVPYLGRKDEIGEMADAVQVFKRNGLEVRRMNAQEAAMRAKSDDLQAGMAEVVSAAAAGDFTARITKDYGDDNLNRFAANINSLLTSVDNGVTETGRVIATLANGDLTQTMNGSYHGVFAQLQ